MAKNSDLFVRLLKLASDDGTILIKARENFFTECLAATLAADESLMRAFVMQLCKPLRSALRTGFLPLADDPGQEFVFGFLASPILVSRPTAENFMTIDGPFLAKVTMNFRIDPIDTNHCTLRTETRIYGSGSDVQRFFAPYWRVIYPGSASMRRMWLRAIRRRAENPDLHPSVKATS